MNEPPAPAPTSAIPRGLVWAGLLLAIAAVIGAVALLLWVLGAPRNAILVGDTVPATGTAGAADLGSTEPPPGSDAGVAYPPPASGASEAPGGPLPVAATLVIEDWATFADDEALAAAVAINEGWANNDLVLALLPASASPQGPAGLALGYEINAAAPNDYVGFEWDLLPTQDWRGYTQLEAWVQSAEPSDRDLVLQFHEWSGEVWRHRLRLRDLPTTGPLRIPLDPDAWEWADWSERQNKILDLHEITRFGIFVGHAGPGAGEVRLGTLGLSR